MFRGANLVVRRRPAICTVIGNLVKLAVLYLKVQYFQLQLGSIFRLSTYSKTFEPLHGEIWLVERGHRRSGD
jgi:hypothetical protein